MDEKYMMLALKEAAKAKCKNDIPVGCVIVKNDKVLASSHNKKESKQIATYHAELLAIQKACKKLNTWHLDDCTLYTTLEPCLMCCGAIIQSRIKTVVYATTNKKFGCVESIDCTLNNEKANHKCIVRTNVCKKESEKLLKNFFKNIRA